jgi:hypothetical protein
MKGGGTDLAWRPDMVTVVERDGGGMGNEAGKVSLVVVVVCESCKLRCRICASGMTGGKRAHGPGVE